MSTLMTQNFKYIRFFKDLSITDIPLVGGKNASLGELYRELRPHGILVPNGFAITSEGYQYHINRSGCLGELKQIIEGLNPNDVEDLARRGEAARELIIRSPIPDDLLQEISSAYKYFQSEEGEGISVAVRSSATAEDLPHASFAGQQDTYLNIKSEADLISSCRRCFASLFTDRAICYRIDNGFDHFKVALSVGVQKMVRSDLATSGVMFSLDTESGFRDVVFITSSYGLGENIVQGTVDPDEFYVHKPTFQEGYRKVLKRHLGEKKIKMVYAEGRTREPTRNIPTANYERDQYSITDDEVLKLAEYAIKIERHYSDKAGVDRPMDIEWAKDGIDGSLYIVQARPETVVSQRKSHSLQEYYLEASGAVMTQGRAVGNKIAAGTVRKILSFEDLSNFVEGEVLVADTTTPDWEPVMRTAAALVTNRGGRTCHAAIIARELGIPAVVGTRNGTEILSEGQWVTISCSEGEVAKVYDGKIPFKVEEIDLSDLKKPKTEIYLNLGNPGLAFQLSHLPVDGVGLARLEFIISESIGIHPMALVQPEKVQETRELRKIETMTVGYEDPKEFFIEKLSEGVSTIASAFYPKPVIVRMSDFKTNEYASLIGGRFFEPSESNPMIGFRGASRYSHPAYQEGFALECEALNRARLKMGFKNIKLMIPFCRNVEEGRRVLETLAEYGLVRGKDDLEIYVMCEIPNNVIQIDEFSDLFDGFSIGSNDLTQLVLGVDRDSELVAFDFDERDPGVLRFLKQAIEGAKRNKRHSGICGQAPSDYPEVAEFLVRCGIDSMSLTPDSVLKTIQQVVELEKKLSQETVSQHSDDVV